MAGYSDITSGFSDDEGTETPNTDVTYAIDAKTVEMLHTSSLRYRLFYRAACRQLKECRISGRTLADELSKIRCLNRTLTTEQFSLQTELDKCYKSKIDMQNLFYMLRRKTIDISKEQLKRQEIYYEKQELKFMQEKLLLQESEFERYERESDVDLPRNSLAERSVSQQSLAETVIEAENQTLNLRLSIEKMEREMKDLQQRLYDSEKSNDKLLGVVNVLEAEKQEFCFNLKQCEQTISTLNGKLLDVQKEYVDLLNQEQTVLKICEREKFVFKESLEKCRENLLEKEHDLENTAQLIKKLEYDLAVVNQDLATSCRAATTDIEKYEAEIFLLNRKNQNLMSASMSAGLEIRELTERNNKILTDFNLCSDELKRVREIEQTQRSEGSNFVQRLKQTIELNNAEYLSKQKEYESNLHRLETDLKAVKNDYRRIKKEKSEISVTNGKLTAQLQDLTKDVTDLQKLKDYVNRFISENYSFIINLDIRSALSKIREKYLADYERFEKLNQLHQTLETKYNESVNTLDQLKKISEEQRSELDNIHVSLDDLRLENQSLKTFGKRTSISVASLADPKSLAKLKRYYRAQLTVKRAEISQLIKKINNLRQENGSLKQQLRKRQTSVAGGPPPSGGSLIKSRRENVVELELEVLRLRGECRTGFRSLRADYQTLVEESADECQRLKDELNRLRDTSDLQVRLNYYNMFVEYLSKAAASLEIQDCPEGFMKLLEMVKDFRDNKLSVSQLRSWFPSTQDRVSDSDISLFQSVQSSLTSEELQTLRIIKQKYDVIISALQYLLSEDTMQTVSTLFEYRLIFARGELLLLTNYLTTENLNLRILKERSDVKNILDVFFDNSHFTSHDVSSLAETLNRFGGLEFLQSLKHIVTLRNVHSEYDKLINLLKDAGAPNQIENFLIWFQLTDDIRLNYPRVTDFEQLKHDYIKDNLNLMFGLDIASLDNYFYLEDPHRRKIPKRLTVSLDRMENDPNVFEDSEEELMSENN